MDPASLPGGTLEHGADSFLQPGVSVGDDQLHPGESSGLQGPQKRGPERFVLRVADVETWHFPAPVRGNPDRDDDGLGDDAVVDSCCAVGRVEEHLRELDRGQVPVKERGNLLIEARADS